MKAGYIIKDDIGNRGQRFFYLYNWSIPNKIGLYSFRFIQKVRKTHGCVGVWKIKSLKK